MRAAQEAGGVPFILAAFELEEGQFSAEDRALIREADALGVEETRRIQLLSAAVQSVGPPYVRLDAFGSPQPDLADFGPGSGEYVAFAEAAARKVALVLGRLAGEGELEVIAAITARSPPHIAWGQGAREPIELAAATAVAASVCATVATYGATAHAIEAAAQAVAVMEGSGEAKRSDSSAGAGLRNDGFTGCTPTHAPAEVAFTFGAASEASEHMCSEAAFHFGAGAGLSAVATTSCASPAHGTPSKAPADVAFVFGACAGDVSAPKCSTATPSYGTIARIGRSNTVAHKWREAARALCASWRQHLHTKWGTAEIGQRCAHSPACNGEGTMPVPAMLLLWSASGDLEAVWGSKVRQNMHNQRRVGVCCGLQDAGQGCPNCGAPVNTDDMALQFVWPGQWADNSRADRYMPHRILCSDCTEYTISGSWHHLGPSPLPNDDGSHECAHCQQEPY